MIRCIRLWTGEDGDFHFEEGSIDLSKGERGDILSSGRRRRPLLPGDEFRRVLRVASGSRSPLCHHAQRHAGVRDARGRALHHPPRRHPACPGQYRLGSPLEADRRRAVAACLCRVPDRCRASVHRQFAETLRPREPSMPIHNENPDVVLIGAGIMSATLGTVLKELEPSLSIAMFETLEDCAQESSAGMEQCRDRPCGQLRAELHAAAAGRQRRHLEGPGGQHRVRFLPPALGLSRAARRDPRSARVHPPCRT